MLLRYRWQKLLNDSDARKQRLLRLQEQYRQVEDLYLTFAKKASTFNSWFENAEEDLTDPVRCNSIEEIKVGDAASSRSSERLYHENLFGRVVQSGFSHMVVAAESSICTSSTCTFTHV